MLQAGFRAVVSGLVLSSLAVACDVGDDCEPIECANGVWVTAAPEGDVWDAGEYELTVAYDGEVESCSFELPKALPTSRVTIYLDCGPRVRASLFALGDCTSCSINDGVELQLFLDATPEELSIELTRDEETVLSDTRGVDYEQIYPRGEECGGGCRQSRFELEVEKKAD